MKLTYEEVKERVDQVKLAKTEFVSMADDMERLYTLQLYDKSSEQVLRDKGQEQVLLPAPMNIILLGQRLLSSEPKIEIPAMDSEKGKDDRAGKLERFLSAFYERSNQEQERNIIGDAAWQTMTFGRGCYMVEWVDKKRMPNVVRSVNLPIRIRTPDPRNVGVSSNSLYKEYAYREYTEKMGKVIRDYPKLKGKLSYSAGSYTEESRLVRMCDFWYRSYKDGSIWHCITADEEMALDPRKTDYPDIPIIEFMGDDAPVGGTVAFSEKMRGVGLLYPVKDALKYYNRLVNTMATGLLYYLWPTLIWKGAAGLKPPDLTVGAGQIVSVPNDGDFRALDVPVNQQLSSQMMEIVSKQIDQATFPAVLYGDAPGQLQAGYGINILADQARGRISKFKRNNEMALQQVNALILAMIESVDEHSGTGLGEVGVWGKDNASGSIYRVSISAKDIKGNYENLVSLNPAIPQDDMQREQLGLSKVQAKIMSLKTYRDKVNSVPLPPDEEQRLLIEMAYQNPEIGNRIQAMAIVAAHPNDWMDILGGTSLEQALPIKEQNKITKARENGKIAGGGMPQQQGMPPPQGAPQQQGMLPPQGAPDPLQMVAEAMIGMMQQGMPPEQAAQMLVEQGAPPDVIMMVMEQLNVAPAGGTDMQTPNAAPGMIPPQMAGQMTPEMLGMSPEQVQSGMFQQLVRGASPDDLDARLGLPRG